MGLRSLFLIKKINYMLIGHSIRKKIGMSVFKINDVIYDLMCGEDVTSSSFDDAVWDIMYSSVDNSARLNLKIWN